MTDSKNTDANQPELTPAQQKEEFARRFLKKITVSPLSEETKTALQHAIETLKKLDQEITGKQDELHNKTHTLKETVSNLNALGKVKINEKDFEQLYAKCEQFSDILKKVADDTKRDIEFYLPFLESKGEEQVSVMVFEPDDFEKFISGRISSIKKHVKNTQRDLAVGSSRYFLGLDHQLRQFEALTNYVSRLK
jgi:hypothetical protein